MEEFYRYTVEELVLNEAFRDLVLRPGPAQQRAFRQWAETHPADSQKFLTAAEIIRSVGVGSNELSAENQYAAVQQIFELTTRKQQTPRLRPLHYWGYAAAAVLALIIGFYMISDKNQSRRIGTLHSENPELGWKSNDGQHAKLIQLADGSSIFLKPGSAVRYPKLFAADKRIVELRGEAFFEIAPDKAKPFYVYSNETVTRVLGTSFGVRTLGQGGETVIGVWSGRVNVSRLNATGPAESVQITPGQQATVSQRQAGIVKSALQSDSKMSQFLRVAANGKDIEVIHYLNTARKAFDLKIGFDPKKLKRCKIRANFEGIHLMEQIDAMCKAINAQYSVQDGEITIKSSGC